MAGFVERAKDYPVILLHENEKGIYGDTAPRCLELMETLASPRFRAVFDFANFVEVGQDTLEAYGLLKPYIGYVHIKDCSIEGPKVVPPGKGDGHLEEILTRLIVDEGYEGFLSMEPHLVDFSGLQHLEQDVAKRESTLEGKAAWKLALDNLREILSRIS